MAAKTDELAVHLVQPVPVDIASCVFTALGQRFPNSTIDMDDSDGHLVIRIQHGDRVKAAHLAGEAVHGIEAEEPSESLADLVGIERHAGNIRAHFDVDAEVREGMASALGGMLGEGCDRAEMSIGDYTMSVRRRDADDPWEKCELLQIQVDSLTRALHELRG